MDKIKAVLAELIETKAIEYKGKGTTPEELVALAEVVNAYHGLMLDF